jgi:hypothetical protein
MQSPSSPSDSSSNKNPYAAPQADLGPAGDSSVAWQGDKLLIPSVVQLPDRCVICNEPVDGPDYKTRTLICYSFWRSLILVRLFFPSKMCDVSFGYCYYHARKRSRRQLSMLGLILLGIVLFVFGGSTMSTWPIAVGAPLILLSLIVLLLNVRTLTLKDAGSGKFLLGGFGPEFVAGNRELGSGFTLSS